MPDDRLPLVSALFITYNRFDLLERAVHSFRQHTVYPNLEIVISDNGSTRDVQEKIRALPADVFAMLPKNRGLGANNNNGIRNCKGKYILMIQDDWLCHGPSDYLANAISVLEANPRLGIINYCGEQHPPDLNQRLTGSSEPCYVTPKPTDALDRREYLYSDQPHLISREAQNFIGPYLEHRQMENCEDDYRLRWEAQSRYLVASFPGYHRRVFTEIELGRSFRSSRARYRVGTGLQPYKKYLPQPVVRVGKTLVMKTIYVLEKLRIVR